VGRYEDSYRLCCEGIIVEPLARPLLHRVLSAEKAAVNSVRAASAPGLESSSGLLLGRRGDPSDPPEIAADRDIAQTVDRISRKLVGLS
jgi:hypothetical protein